jgi:hypothetical protein
MFKNILCSLITILALTHYAQAQETAGPALGVYWDPPSSPTEIRQELQEFRELGIRFIETDRSFNGSVIDSASAYGFDILIRSDKEFLISSVVASSRNELLSEYQALKATYSQYPRVRGIGLYSHSESFDTDFIETFQFITEQLRDSTSPDFYEITTGAFNAVDFGITEYRYGDIPSNSGSILFTADYSREGFVAVDRLFKENIGLLIFDASWLLEAVDDYPPFEQSLREYADTGEWVFPLPEVSETATSFNWLVLIFILIWISVAVHIRTVATYSSLVMRYFTGHRFFVDDIMRYRERSAASGIFLFFQHAAFTGLVAAIFGEMFISDTGIRALFHYLPQFAITGQNHFSIFLGGFLIACLVQVVGLAWLYFPSKSMNHFSQVITLYTWIFHLDFIIVSIMLVTYLTGGSSTFILILSALFILIWLTSFLLTSLDSSKYLMQKRLSYILYTFGLHALVNVAVLILILMSPVILDVIELVVVI